MASRKEQKEQARARRLAEEQARKERERRQRRLQMVGGTVLAAIAIAAVVIAIGSGGKSAGGSTPIQPSANGVKLPAQRISDLKTAVKAAGCTTTDTPDSVARTDKNRTHMSPGTKIQYATNPASYGPHYPAPASDGEYKPGHVPAVPYLVHAMEHGRIEYQYTPGLPAADVKQLEALFNEQDGQWAPGQMLVLFPNSTKMPYAVAATAWGHVIGCKTFNTGVFDAFRAFRLAYTNQGPEQLGTGPE